MAAPSNKPGKATPGPAAIRSAPWAVLAGGAAIAAAAVAAYWGTFLAPLHFDDGPAITANTTLRHLATAFAPPVDATVGGRPVLNLSLALNYAISGTAVWSYHVLNLAIHVLAGLTLFGIVRRTLLPRSGAAATLIAFTSALLWTLHPLQTESVTYVIQRAESLMGLFYLLTLYCFIRGTAAEGRQCTLWHALAIAACLLGMGTKEVMVSAPLVVFLYDRTFAAGSFREAWRRRRWVHVGMAATWLVLPALVRSAHGRGGSAGYASGVSWWAYALTQMPAIVHYLRLSIWPHPLVFDYGSALARPSPAVLGCALAVAGLAAATAWALVKRPAAGFLGACFFAILAPSSSIVPVATETLAEHRMYLPLASVAVLAALGIHRCLARAALPACLALAAGLFAATWQRNAVYQSDEGIWADTVAKRPGNARAHNNLGYALSRIPGRLDDALAQYDEAIRLKPDYAQAHGNLAAALVGIPGRQDEALAQLEETLRLEPGVAEAHYNLGCALDKIPGRSGEAITLYEEAVRLAPDYAEAHYNLGCALGRIPGRLSEAIAQFEETIRIRPDSFEAHFNLGCALETLPGRLNDAVAQYQEALRLSPGRAGAHFNLGRALQTIPGRLGDAIAQYEEALRLDPGFAQAHFSLGIALEAVPGGRDGAIAQYEEALRLDPGFAAAHYNLGCVLQQTPGRLEDAVAQYEEALRLGPDNAQAQCNLGNALDSLGRTQDAISHYVEALRLKPDDATIHLNLAIVLLKIVGREGEAVAQLREALALQPDNQLARRMLGRVSPPGP